MCESATGFHGRGHSRARDSRGVWPRREQDVGRGGLPHTRAKQPICAYKRRCWGTQGQLLGVHLQTDQVERTELTRCARPAACFSPLFVFGISPHCPACCFTHGYTRLLLPRSPLPVHGPAPDVGATANAAVASGAGGGRLIVGVGDGGGPAGSGAYDGPPVGGRGCGWLVRWGWRRGPFGRRGRVPSRGCWKGSGGHRPQILGDWVLPQAVDSLIVSSSVGARGAGAPCDPPFPLHDPVTPGEGTLHYTTLHYTTLHYTTLHYTTLHYTTLHYTTLHYTTLHCTALHCTTLHCTALHYTTLHYTTLHYTTLHYTTLHYTTLHYTTLHYTTLRYCTVRCGTVRYCPVQPYRVVPYGCPAPPQQPSYWR